MVKWLFTIKQAGDSSITIEKMELDDKGFPQPTGRVRNPGSRLGGAGAGPGRRPRLCWTACRDSK